MVYDQATGQVVLFGGFNGARRTYRPDFLVKLTNGSMLVLEVKGQERTEDKAKRGFLEEWINAVNQHGGFGGS